MNKRLHEMIMEATKDMPQGYYVPGEYFEKFAELIVEESITLLKREWYALNNAPAGETETPRDIGLRVGARDQTGHLINVFERHFEV